MESDKDLFHENVRQSFLKQAREKSASWLVLDARRTPAELAEDLLSALTKRTFLKA
jgi:dTMP kinase